MSEEDDYEWVIDYEKIGKKGYPIHYKEYGMEPPMKRVLKEKEKEKDPEPE